MIKSVTFNFGGNTQSTFEVGSFLMKGGEKTDVKVEKISVNLLDTARINLSSGDIIVYRNFPFIVVEDKK